MMKTRLGAIVGRRRISAGCLLLATLTWGCSDNYDPLTEDHFVSISIRGANSGVGIKKDGVLYEALVLACIGHEDANWGWGFFCRRRGVSDEYDPDTIVVDSLRHGSYELPCPIWDLSLSTECVAHMKDAPHGVEFRFTVNEYTESKVTMPEVPVLFAPAPDSQFHVSSGEDLVLRWSPIASGDPMFWNLRSSDTSDPDNPCGDVSWPPLEGELDDTGSLTIPSSALPKGIPASGCRAKVVLRVVHEGTLDPKIKRGRIVGEQSQYTEITLLP
jgi:hypothetical protein